MWKLASVILVAAACGGTSDTGPRASGQGFSVRIPDGYQVVTDEKVAAVTKAGGVVLTTDPTKAGIDAITASIVVVPVTEPLAGDPSDEKACVALAKDAARALPGKVLGARKVKLSTGASCQYELAEEKDANAGSVGTVVTSKAGSFVITCNLDLRADRHRDACNAVVKSFKVQQ